MPITLAHLAPLYEEEAPKYLPRAAISDRVPGKAYALPTSQPIMRRSVNHFSVLDMDREDLVIPNIEPIQVPVPSPHHVFHHPTPYGGRIEEKFYSDPSWSVKLGGLRNHRKPKALPDADLVAKVHDLERPVRELYELAYNENGSALATTTGSTPLRTGGSGSIRQPLPPWSDAVSLEVSRVVSAENMTNKTFREWLPAITDALHRIPALMLPPSTIARPRPPVGCTISGEALGRISDLPLPHDWLVPSTLGPFAPLLGRSGRRIRLPPVIMERVVALARSDCDRWMQHVKQYSFRAPLESLHLPGNVLPDKGSVRQFNGATVVLPYASVSLPWTSVAGMLDLGGGDLSCLGFPDFFRLMRFPHLLDNFKRPVLSRLFQEYLPHFLSFLESKPSHKEVRDILADPSLMWGLKYSGVLIEFYNCIPTLPLRSITSEPITTQAELSTAVSAVIANKRVFQSLDYVPIASVSRQTFAVFKEYSRSVVSSIHRQTTPQSFADSVNVLTQNLCTAYRCSGKNGTTDCAYYYTLVQRALRLQDTAPTRAHWVVDSNVDDLEDPYHDDALPPRSRVGARPAHAGSGGHDIKSRVKPEDISTSVFYACLRRLYEVQGLCSHDPLSVFPPSAGAPVAASSDVPVVPHTSTDALPFILEFGRSVLATVRSDVPLPRSCYEALASGYAAVRDCLLAFLERVQPFLASLLSTISEAPGGLIQAFRLFHAAIATRAHLIVVDGVDHVYYAVHGFCRGGVAACDSTSALLSSFYGAALEPHASCWQLRDIAMFISIGRSLLELYHWLMDAAARAFGGEGRNFPTSEVWLSRSNDLIATLDVSRERLAEMAAHAALGLNILSTRRDAGPISTQIASTVAKLMGERSRRTVRQPTVLKVEPIAIMISGKPGVGKDLFATALANNLAANVGSTVWHVNAAAEYDSGFMGQTVAVQADWLQCTATEDVTSDLLLFCHRISAENSLAETADLNGKGIPMELKFSIHTTNVKVVSGQIDIPSAYIISRDAILRRIGMTMELQRHGPSVYARVVSHNLRNEPVGHTIDSVYTVAQIAQWALSAYELKVQFAQSLAAGISVANPMRMVDRASSAPLDLNPPDLHTSPHSYIPSVLGATTALSVLGTAAYCLSPRLLDAILARYLDYLAARVKDYVGRLICSCASFVSDGLSPVWAAAVALYDYLSGTVLEFARAHPRISLVASIAVPLCAAWYAFNKVVAQHSSPAVPTSSDGQRALQAIKRRPVTFHVSARESPVAPHSLGESVHRAVDNASSVIIAYGASGTVVGSGVFTMINADVGLTVAHVIEGATTFKIQNRFERQPVSYNVSECHIVCSVGATDDLALLRLPRGGRSPGASLTRFFSLDIDDSLPVSNGIVVTPRGDVELSTVRVSGAATWGTKRSEVTYTYNYSPGALAPGSSGALLLSGTSIIGIHAAGSSSTGYGVAIPLTSAIISGLLSDPSTTLPSPPVVAHSSSVPHPQGLSVTPSSLRASSGLSKSAFELVPDSYRARFQALSSKPLKVPVYWHLNAENAMSAMRQGPMPVFSYDTQTLRRAVNWLYALTYSVRPGLVLEPLPTISYDEAFRLSDPTASCGLPFTTQRTRLKGDMGLNGCLTPYFQGLISNLASLAREGRPVEDTGLLSHLKVKDEALPPGKVPRVIHIMPGTFCVLQASHCFKFCQDLMERRRNSGGHFYEFEGVTYPLPSRLAMASGTNPHCSEWGEIRAALGSNPILDIDIAKCDDSIGPFFFDCFSDFFNARVSGDSCVYREDGGTLLPRVDSVRDREFKTIMGWVPKIPVFIQGLVAARVYGNTSGQRLTTEVNGFVACVGWMYALMRVYPEPPPLLYSKSPMVCSGDDILVALHRSHSFGAVSTRALQELGVDYGPGNKAARVDGPDRTSYDDYVIPHDEVLFLKRSFAPTTGGLVLSPLEFYTILSCLSIRRRTDPGRAFQAARLEVMLVEASKHGPLLYESVASIVAAMASEERIPLRRGFPPPYGDLRRRVEDAALSAPGTYSAEPLELDGDLEPLDLSHLPDFSQHSLVVPTQIWLPSFRLFGVVIPAGPLTITSPVLLHRLLAGAFIYIWAFSGYLVLEHFHCMGSERRSRLSSLVSAFWAGVTAFTLAFWDQL